MPSSFPHFASLSGDITALAKAAAPTAVSLEDHGRSFSGFYWREDVVVTASDMLEARTGKAVTVMVDGQAGTVEGTVIARDPSTDIALIRVAKAGSKLPAAEGAAKLGEAVVAVGRGAHGAICGVGFVALAEGPWRSMRGGEISSRVWIDMRLRRQLEGGAVVNSSGGLLGMAVLGPRRRALLIPAETIDRVGQELMTHGRIRRGYLGVSVRPVPVPVSDETSERRSGLIVLSLDPAGPAARGGLHQGDVITAIAGQHPESPRQLAHLLRRLPAGQAVDVTVLRSGNAQTMSVMIGERPVA